MTEKQFNSGILIGIIALCLCLLPLVNTQHQISTFEPTKSLRSKGYICTGRQEKYSSSGTYWVTEYVRWHVVFPSGFHQVVENATSLDDVKTWVEKYWTGIFYYIVDGNATVYGNCYQIDYWANLREVKDS